VKVRIECLLVRFSNAAVTWRVN